MAKILKQKHTDHLTPVEGTTPRMPAETGTAKTPTTELMAGPFGFDMLRREMDRLFDEFGFGGWRLPFGRETSFELPDLRRERFAPMPAIDMTENGEAYRLSVELPGLGEKDVEVKIAGRTLTIRGEKTEDKVEDEDSYHLSERRYGSFQRSFRLPDGVDEDRIMAAMADGVLTLTLPKTAEAKTVEKTIKVEAA